MTGALLPRILFGAAAAAALVACSEDSGPAPFSSRVPLPRAPSNTGAPSDGETILPPGPSEPSTEVACDPDEPFGAPARLAELSAADSTVYPSLTRDGLAIFFMRQVVATASRVGLFVARRASRDVGFGSVVPAGELAGSEYLRVAVTSDGFRVYGDRYVTHADGARRQLFFSNLQGSDDSFGSALPALSLPPPPGVEDAEPYLVDGRALYFTSSRQGPAWTLYRAAQAGATFSSPEALTVKSPDGGLTTITGVWPVAASDELAIYFAWPGSGPGHEIWRARRASTDAPFEAPTIVTELSSSANELPASLSRDGCTLYFSSDRGSSAYEVFVATRQPR